MTGAALMPSSAGGNTGFLVPESPIAYTAYYIVNEGGQESAKIVYRNGQMMRTDYDAGNVTISVYFLKNRAYSCAKSLDGSYNCFDITGSAAAQGVGALIGTPDLENAEKAESVGIGQGGQMAAQCYIFNALPHPGRKMCFTDGGILAYDEYTLSGGRKRVEYLGNLKLSAGLQSFGLPATPAMPPQNSSAYQAE